MKQHPSERIKQFAGKLPFPVRLLALTILGLLSLAIISGIVLAISSSLFLFFNPDYIVPRKMFSTIEECQRLDELAYTNATVNVHDNTSTDQYIKDFKYADFYVSDFQSDELSFTIFAYEFYDEESAEKYFYYASGHDPDRYSTVTSVRFNSEFFAIDGNKVYRTECVITHLYELLVSLSHIFSNDI